MTITLTYDEVKAAKPCANSLRRVSRLLGGAEGWNGNRISAAEARAAGCTFNDIVWIASAIAKTDADVERRVRLWMADCAARVLHIYEKTESSEAPRNAIIAARQFARGEIDDSASASAAWAAKDAAGDAERFAASTAANAAANAAAKDAAWTAKYVAWDAAWAAKYAGGAEEAWQFDCLIARLSDDEPDDVPLPTRQRAD